MTDNHDYNTPAEGATGWHIPLNENFENLDADVAVRDVASNRSKYDPKAGATFVETDTGIVYLGDGSSWQPALSLARFFRGSEGDNETATVVNGHPDNDVGPGVVGATIAGGGRYRTGSGLSNDNRVTANYGTVGGGYWNTASGDSAAVGGGHGNDAQGASSVVPGGTGNTASGESAAVSGGDVNLAAGKLATVSGGGSNEASGEASTVAGGLNNESKDVGAIVGGGRDNVVEGIFGTVAGGRDNTVSGAHGSIGGGQKNDTVRLATVAGGSGNDADAVMSTIGGGVGNRTGGGYAVVPGGSENAAIGGYSFAAGRKANADANGAFVWGDASTQNVRSTVENEFKVQAGGGVVFYSKSDLSAGVSLASGSGSWSTSSSRTVKENVHSVDPVGVLEGVRGLDVSTWRYTAQDDEVIHMGPMAENFYDTFGLGEDDESISAVDADGVAFAAIQGLADRQDEQVLAIEGLRAENEELRRDNEALEARLDSLEARVDGAPGGV